MFKMYSFNNAIYVTREVGNHLQIKNNNIISILSNLFENIQVMNKKSPLSNPF